MSRGVDARRASRNNGPVEIPAKAEYAVRAMLTLAAVEAGDEPLPGEGGVAPRPVSVERLAAEQGLPHKFLEGIVGELRRAGLVVSRRGARGGYRLSRPAGEIAIGDIIRAVDGPLAEVRGHRPHETSYTGSAAHLDQLWVALRVAMRRVLDGTSLEQLRTGDLPEEVRVLTEDPDARRNRC